MELIDIQNQVNGILCAVLRNPNITIGECTTAADIPEWDSLSNIIIFKELETQFNIKFKLREILKLKDIGELCSCICKKLD